AAARTRRRGARHPVSRVMLGALQWGRRTYAAERSIRLTRAIIAARASMGPPHVRGGERITGPRCAGATPASMGPPHVRGGETAHALPGGGTYSLQWGRRTYAAERARTRRGDPRTGPASMGPPHVR